MKKGGLAVVQLSADYVNVDLIKTPKHYRL